MWTASLARHDRGNTQGVIYGRQSAPFNRRKTGRNGKRLSAIYSRAEKEIQKTADEYFSKFAAQDEKKRKLLEQGEELVLKLVPVTDGTVFRFYDMVSKAFFDSITDTPLDGGNL